MYGWEYRSISNIVFKFVSSFDKIQHVCAQTPHANNGSGLFGRVEAPGKSLRSFWPRHSAPAGGQTGPCHGAKSRPGDPAATRQHLYVDLKCQQSKEHGACQAGPAQHSATGCTNWSKH